MSRFITTKSTGTGFNPDTGAFVFLQTDENRYLTITNSARRFLDQAASLLPCTAGFSLP